MKIVIFGLSISSSWGNGHATLWRALCKALIARGHAVTFYERDVSYYAMNRDLWELPGGKLVLYEDWNEAQTDAEIELRDADVLIVTSYCHDALAIAESFSKTRALRIFYDLDTPVTFARIAAGESVSYIGPRGLRDYHLALSFTGGEALRLLQDELGAPQAAPFYGCVDPDLYHIGTPQPQYRAALSYIGTYAADRQAKLAELFIEPAKQLPGERFVIAGAQYPANFPWVDNIHFVQHLPPGEHPSFYAASRLTLNITRDAMANMGYCPSGRLFEAAACGAVIISDEWPGLDEFFEPNEEIIIASNRDDVLAALQLSDGELSRLANAARGRVLREHSAARRVEELEALLESVASETVGV